MGKRELVALISLSSWCLTIVVWLFLAVKWGCLRFVIVVFPDHTHLQFLGSELSSQKSDCSLSFQLARLETYQVGNVVSPTRFIRCAELSAGLNA